ncbi:MAG: TVP38/TMEM64 family protein, partial [Proteobacteria bacterium]|nr:TVP38/TMEM64 family protein [Pseudomonadota bacterium]
MKQATINKIIIVVAILLLILLFKILHLDQYLTLSYLKESREQFSLLYAERTGLVIAGYMLIYILATALSLPGAVILTLAGGALFGLVTGTIVISFASTIGATLACMVSRFLLRDWVQARFGEKLERINEGI